MNSDRERLLAVLSEHIGADLGVHCSWLAYRVFGDYTPAAQRRVRQLIVELRREGEHICGTPAAGYFMAACRDELDQTCRFLYDRAMTSLTQVSAMKRVSLPDLAGQLRIRIEDQPRDPK